MNINTETQGSIDSTYGSLLFGWTKKKAGTAQTVELWIDKKKISSQIANQDRSRKYFVYSGDCDGFIFYIPMEYRDNKPHLVEIINQSNRYLVDSRTITFSRDLRKHESFSNDATIQRINLTENRQSYLPSVNNKHFGLFTIASKNYISYARVLLKSVAKAHPEYSLYLCLVDKIDGYFDADKEPYTVVEVEEIGINNFNDMMLRYDIMELNTAVKPFMFKWLFKNTTHDSLIYLDPDIKVYSRLDVLEQTLNEKTSIVLTPHITEPIDDEYLPNDHSMLQSGVFNLGFIAAKRCKETEDYIEWWSKKLQTLAKAQLTANLFTDQRWCDLAPCILKNLKILKSHGYNVAYWNLNQRNIRKNENSWEANETPLVFFHFSGINPKKREVVSKHQTRFRWDDLNSACKLLFNSYHDDLLESEWEVSRLWPYAYDSINEKFKLSNPIRSLYSSIYPNPLNITKKRIQNFIVAMCNSRAECNTINEDRYVTNLMFHIYNSRDDLKITFDLRSNEGKSRFVSWYEESALREYNLPDPVVKEAHRSAIDRINDPAEIIQFSIETKVSNFMLSIWNSRQDLQQAFDISTHQGQKDFIHWCEDGLRREYNIPDRKYILSLNNDKELKSGILYGDFGANLIGYAHAELGMGEHVRMTAEAFSKMKINYGIVNYDYGVVSRQKAELDRDILIKENSYRVNLFHINADQMFDSLIRLGQGFFSNKYNIGYWAWELSGWPEEWDAAIDIVDEIWAPSRFIQKTLNEVTGKPVFYAPLCVELPSFKKHERSYYGLPTEKYLFVYAFDFNSYIHRKNPFGLINAFKLAFSKEYSKVGLVIKIMNGNESSEAWKEMLELIGNDDRIYLINKTMDRASVLGLINVCNAYVSLHRSEGFGRGPAEAMYLGKPVIATNYSGNQDFTLFDNSCLVDYKLIPVQKGQYPSVHNQVWADPDLDHAAWYMKKLFDDHDFANKIGQSGELFIKNHFNSASVGSRYKKRLEKIGLI